MEYNHANIMVEKVEDIIYYEEPAEDEVHGIVATIKELLYEN